MHNLHDSRSLVSLQCQLEHCCCATIRCDVKHAGVMLQLLSGCSALHCILQRLPPEERTGQRENEGQSVQAPLCCLPSYGPDCKTDVAPALSCILVLGLLIAAGYDNDPDRSSATLDDGPVWPSRAGCRWLVSLQRGGCPIEACLLCRLGLCCPSPKRAVLEAATRHLTRTCCVQACACALLALLAVVSAQPFLPGQNLLPAGNLRTTDGSGPNVDGSFNLTLLTTQENQLKGEALLSLHALACCSGLTKLFRIDKVAPCVQSAVYSTLGAVV